MEIDGNRFQAMCESAADSISNKQEEINDLNVFPVPDGDTGVNMSMTMKPVREIHVEMGTLSEAAAHIADKVIRAARGNSGAILSLFFRGMAKSFKGLDSADSEDIAKAIRSGTDEAYRAVSKPTEGTILTVMRTTADTAEAESELYQGDPEAFFERLVESAEDVLNRTPDMLPALKEAKVVDAGGSGFVAILKGMLASLKGEKIERNDSDDTKATGTAAGITSDVGDIRYAYCTECIVNKSAEYVGEESGKAFYNLVSAWGDSVVFVNDETFFKIHIHTNRPGDVLTAALTFGALEMVKVENMRIQHSRLTDGAEQKETGPQDTVPAVLETAPVPQDTASVPQETELPEIDREYGFVSVCLGDGNAAVFRDLGADAIVSGGQTMNPSCEDLLNAARLIPAKTVFILPNNKNIIMVANQAAAIIEEEGRQTLTVIESRSIPEGVAAMMAFDPDTDANANAEAMRGAMADVHTLSVTRAVKDAAVDGMSIRAGEYMGLCDRKIGYTGVSRRVIVLEMLKNFPKCSNVTVFYGKDVTEECAERLENDIGAMFPDADVTVVNGGQPLYDFFISVE